MQQPLGRDFDQLAGDFTDALLEPRLAGLPAAAAEPIELDARLFRAVARQQLDVLHRQKQLVAAGIVDLQAIVRRARGLDIHQADEAANAMVDMHHEIAGREARDLGDEVLGAPRRAPRPHQPVAQDVLFADHGELGGLEAGLEAKHRKPDLLIGPRQRVRPAIDVHKIAEAVIEQHVAHALARALAPQCDDHPLAGRLEGMDVRAHRVEHIAARFGPFGREVAALACGDVDDVAAIRHRERRHPGKRPLVEPRAPFGIREVEPVGRQRLVRRPSTIGPKRLTTRSVIVLDLREPFVGRILGERLDDDRRSRDVVEQRIELVVKQRQPMLHAGVPSAFAHRLVKHVVAIGRAEQRDIALAEPADGLGGELQLADRDEIEGAHLERGALGLRIEAADRFERVAEEVEPHRQVHPGRKQIDDAAAYRVLAGVPHRRAAREAIELEPTDHAVHRQLITGRCRERLTGHQPARRHALERRIDRGEENRRPLARRGAGKPRQRDHPLRHDGSVRRDPVIGLAIPRGELLDRDVRGEEAKRAGKLREPLAVAADDRQACRRRIGTRRDRARQIGEHESLRTIGDARQRERTVGVKPLGGRTRHVHFTPDAGRNRRRAVAGTSGCHVVRAAQDCR